MIIETNYKMFIKSIRMFSIGPLDETLAISTRISIDLLLSLGNQ